MDKLVVGNGENGVTAIQYGRFIEFLDVAAALTCDVRRELLSRRDLCTNAVLKLAEASQRVEAMEVQCHDWKTQLARMKDVR